MNRALKANSATRRPTRNWRPRALDTARSNAGKCGRFEFHGLGLNDVDEAHTKIVDDGGKARCSN